MMEQNSETTERTQQEMQATMEALKARLINRILSARSLDSHSLSFLTYFMSRAMAVPEECVIQVDHIEMPLVPLTEANLEILRDAIVDGDVTVSLTLEL
jgi:hypothetical protein